MKRRSLAVLALCAAIAACGSPLENATATLIEQVRLGDPLAATTYEENKDILESAEALPIWMGALQNDESPNVQEWAAQIVGNIGDPSSLPALAAAMSQSRGVRDAAVAAIHKFDDEQAAEAFGQALQSGSRDAKAIALAQISRLEAPGAVSAVAQVAGSDDEMLSHPAMTTLADIGTDEAAASLASLALDPALPMACRGLAISNLSRIESAGATEQISAIQTALESEEGADALLAQVRALKR